MLFTEWKKGTPSPSIEDRNLSYKNPTIMDALNHLSMANDKKKRSISSHLHYLLGFLDATQEADARMMIGFQGWPDFVRSWARTGPSLWTEQGKRWVVAHLRNAYFVLVENALSRIYDSVRKARILLMIGCSKIGR